MTASRNRSHGRLGAASRALGATAAVVGMLAAAPAPAAIAHPGHTTAVIHAHRGGPLENGKPVASENTMSAFRRVVARWRPELVELDAKLTRDDVPVVIHDPDLDRTTNCIGPVRAKTLAELRACLIDRLGTDGAEVEIPGPSEGIPTLAEVLDWAKGIGQRLNLEIKNVPTDGDFDPTSAYADRVLDEVLSRGMQDLVVIQSFWPDNLDRAETREPKLATSFLTLAQTNEGGVAFAGAQDYDILSPQWKPATGSTYFSSAKSAGLPVVPWTLDTEAASRASCSPPDKRSELRWRAQSMASRSCWSSMSQARTSIATAPRC